MRTVADTHHLISRKGRWYYHRRVPQDLRAQYGSVIKEALGTTDKKEAIRLREIRDVQWSARFAAAPDQEPRQRRSFVGGGALDRGRRRLSEPLAIELVRAYVERTDARYRTAWELKPPKGPARDQAIENAELDLAVASDRAPPS